MKELEELKSKLPKHHLKLFNLDVEFYMKIVYCSREFAELQLISKWLNIDKVAPNFKH